MKSIAGLVASCLPSRGAGAILPEQGRARVLPFAAGAAPDIIGSAAVAQKLNEIWVSRGVEQPSRGSTVIGTDVVSKSPAGRLHLLVTPAPSHRSEPSPPRAAVRPGKGFEPITLINTTPRWWS